LDFRHISAARRLVPVLLIALALAGTTAHAASGPDASSKGLRLAAMLGSQDAAKRAKGLSALRAWGQESLPGLLAAMEAPSAEVRRGAVMGAALQPAPALAMESLLNALGDPDATVRSLAAHTLARLGPLAATDVARLLASPTHDIRVAAALCLSRMGPDAVPALAMMMRRDDPPVQANAAWLLGGMGSNALPAAPALIHALDTDDPRLVHVIAETLDLIGPDAATVLREMTLISARESRPFSRMGAAAAPTLVKLLSRPGTPMGQMALFTLARMGNQAKPALQDALATGTEGQRAAAALLLTGIDPNLARTLPEDLRRTLGGAIHLN
jgi:HEAT repeat protein